MLERLPLSVQPDSLVARGTTLRGSLAFEDMPRLAGTLYDGTGAVEAELEFGVDAGGVKYLRGRVRATLRLVCQRCLEPLRHTLALDMNLGLVSSEAAAERLPAAYEPCVFEGPSLALGAVVEDELLLALPIVPRHRPAECGVQDLSFGAPAPEPDRQRPFAGLAERLRRDGEAGS